jgi:hypothetical protein
VDVLPLFKRLLPSRTITALVTATGKRFYQRLFLPSVIVWGFAFQRLNPDHTCDAAVSYLASGAADELCPTLSVRMSDNTAGYCKARVRLPLGVLQGALRHTAHALHDELGAAGLWQGRRVYLLDGSTLVLPAAAELIDHYGRPSNQHGEAHWPLLRLVVGFDLYSGTAAAVAEGPYRDSEQALAVRVISELGARSVCVGDRNFGVYHVVQVAQHHGTDVVFRLTASRAKALAHGSLRPGDDLWVEWSPSRHDTCEPDLPTLPVVGRLIYVRLERPGFRPKDLYLFTTLTDREQYPLLELVQLYGRRWEVELDLRHVKTTLDMASLAGKSVEMVRKELWAGLLTYNLVRGLMGLAAQRAGLAPLVLSFARCWRRISDTAHTVRSGATLSEMEATLERLLNRLARCRLPKRKAFRIEPRAAWGRPRVFPRLNGTREAARQAVLAKMAQES